MKKKLSKRLTEQHKLSKGVEGIFGEDAKLHDFSVKDVSMDAMDVLKKEFPELNFRYRKSISKSELNNALAKVDPTLGQTLFVQNASVKPDGGLVEVQDKHKSWRIILASEAKRQGKDIENIKQGKLVGKDKNQDLMVAGNAIERSHKMFRKFLI